MIDEYFFDPASGEERPLGRIINTYSIEGWITREEHYDAHFNLQYAICRDYDRYGNVILEQNALGQITQRRYDCFGNKLWEQGPDSSYHFEYVYDYANRLIAEERVCSDGARFNQTYRYDLLGNKIASFDIYGNETSFRYDAFGHVVETLYPACGEAGRLRTTQEYDIAGNVTAITDVDGNTTRKTYNIRGQQTSILNPDGTIERFEYNLNGTLHKQTAVNGLVTRLSYDLLGNCIRKEIFTSIGELLALTSAIYQGDTLLSETDANGNTTTYVHDGAGRPIAVHKPHTTIHYLYDALGRKAKTIEGQRVSVTEYDLLDRVIEERTEDLEGLVFTRTLYGYDAAGHRTTVTSFTDQGPNTTQSFYNAHGQIYRVVDAEGHETVTHHDYGFLNAYGQRVWHVTQVDALGKQTIKTYDTLGRIALVVHRDPFNQELSRTLSHYDGRGNLTKRTDTVKAEGYEDREVIAEWRYDALARIVELVEGSGTPERRQTFYSYNRYGQKQNEILADGTLLKYSYDAFGRIERYESSDGTFCYLYTYDPIGNLIRVDDTVNGNSTKRTYDSANRLTAETLGNGLTTSYQYDALGRLTQLSIPDGSRIAYTYDASSMRTVRRLDAAGNEIYSHAYLTYDLAGNLTSSKMIGEAGEILFKRDQLSRVRELKTDAFRETIPPGGYDAVGNLLTKTRHDAAGDVPCSFGYDARYQIASETGQAAHTYRYDSLDNRLVKDQEICEIDALNQLVRQGERRFAYDQRGNRTQSEKTHYAYDALGRLTEVTSEDRRFVYTYDSFNRRLSKTSYTLGNSSIERYLYQEQMEIGVVDAQDRIVEFRALGQGLGAEIAAAISIEIGDQVYAPIHDHSGHVVALVDVVTGKTAACYRYSVFGEEEVVLGEAIANPWRYSSKRKDPETGLINFGRRYYDPTIGRWLTPDPAGYQDGPNLYAYVHNSPLTHFDLYGLQTSSYWENRRNTPRYNNGQGPKWFHCPWFESVHAIFRPSRNYTVPGKELAHGVICFTNGMKNVFSAARGHAEHISKLAGNCIVQGTLNQTHGYFSDLIECAMGYCRITTDPVILLHQKWNEQLANRETLMEICTSQGALHVRNALATYPPELRQRILVLAIAPAAYIPAEYCRQVWHYRNEDWTRDPIPYKDKNGAARAQREGTIRQVKSAPGAPMFDHSISSDTFNDVIDLHTQTYIRSQGRKI